MLTAVLKAKNVKPKLGLTILLDDEQGHTCPRNVGISKEKTQEIV